MLGIFTNKGALSTGGLNNIKEVADFSKSATELKLMEGDWSKDKKLQNFFHCAADMGMLSTASISPESITQMIGSLKNQGVLAPDITSGSVVKNLVQSGKNLGVTGNNVQEEVGEIVGKVKAVGLDILNIVKKDRADKGKAINANRLHFAPYAFQDILQLNMTHMVNEHAHFYIKGVLPENTPEDYVQITEENTAVTLHYLDENGNAWCIFNGIVTNIKQKTAAKLKYLELEAVSYSFLLDTKKISRSFQRHNENYQYILERINEFARQYITGLNRDIVKADDSDTNEKTDELIMQYHETDWEFLKRLASHFNQGLIANITSENPEIYFGLPPEKQTAETEDDSGAPGINVSSYKIIRDTRGYALAANGRRENSGKNFSPIDFTCYEVQSINIVGLGQKIKFSGRNFFVKSIHTFLEKGVVSSIYTLSTQNGLLQNDADNYNLAGISLYGIVKKVERDTVQVHFTSDDYTWQDEEWDDRGTYMFPYTTVYSSPDGSGWYCMPEVNDNVRVYFPNHEEKNAVASSSINPTSEKRGGRDNPDDKTMSNVHGKKIILSPGGIQVISNDKLMMSLTDDGGLSVMSDKKIIMKAEEAIEIMSKDKIIVSSEQEVLLSQGASSISLKNNINMAGKVNLQS